MFNRKPMVYRYRPLVSIGYKYNAWKVLYFIDTEYAGSAKADISYLSSTLNSLPMLLFSLLIVPLSCLSSLDMLMRINPTTKPDSMI